MHVSTYGEKLASSWGSEQSDQQGLWQDQHSIVDKEVWIPILCPGTSPPYALPCLFPRLGVQNQASISSLWALCADILDAEAGTRLFGFIGAGTENRST